MKHLSSRLVFSVLAMVAATAMWSQAIYLDGHKAVHDSRNGMWLCSVPQETFGTDWSPVVEFDSTWTDVSIAGAIVANGGQVTFEGIEGSKLYPFSTTIGEKTLQGNITFTWLPVLELEGEFGNEYVEGFVSLNAPDTAESKDSMLAKLKWRGGITNSGDKHKRNYHIKFLDETGEKKNRRLLGMRKDNHWKLDGGQIDLLRIRNRVCADLWLDMSRQPWHAEIDPTVINGSRGKMTEVILNGKYHGIYNLMEPVDRKQLGLVKHDTINNVFHGQQWVAKLLRPTWQLPIYNNNSETWNGNEVSYPEFEDVSPTDWSTLYNAFEFVRKCDAVDNYSLLTDSIANYFDIPVMEDYYIFLITLQALDNECANIYYAVQNFRDNQRITMIPWDLDISLGQNYAPGVDLPDMVSPERYPAGWISHVPMADMMEFKRYRNQVLASYHELRETKLNTDSLVARFRRAVDELVQCGAVAREEARWSGDSDLNGKVLDINGEMDYIDDWIHRRMAYLDQNVFVRLTGDVNDDGEVNIADVNQVIDSILSGKQNTACDVNGDDEVNINDVNLIIGIILK